MTSTLLMEDRPEKKLNKVVCTECGEMTWNTDSKLCNRCYRYMNDI